MELSLDLLPAYVVFLNRAIDDPVQRPTLEKLRADVEAGKRVLVRTRVQIRANGAITASISVEPVTANIWLLNELRVLPDASPSEREAATALIAEAVAQARSEGATKIEARISEKTRFDAYDRALEAAGLSIHGERIEFTASVAELPDDTGTPLVWKAATQETFEDAARLLSEVSRGDPDWDQNDDPAELLRGWLSDDYFGSTLEAVHVGLLDRDPVALVVAQVSTTGFSRITYMGLVPSIRGKSLGSWVHRHGSYMLKSQGGKKYRGGTSTTNGKMIALFKRHGCRESGRFEDWVWRADEPESP